uniref:Trehalase n=1 Tax=Acrobeloides nanus TaxID=290746 RepID=A0A914DHT7_9BILA
MRQPIIFWFRPHASRSGRKNYQNTKCGRASQISQLHRRGGGAYGSPVQQAAKASNALYTARIEPSITSRKLLRASDQQLVILFFRGDPVFQPVYYNFHTPILALGGSDSSSGISTQATSRQLPLLRTLFETKKRLTDCLAVRQFHNLALGQHIKTAPITQLPREMRTEIYCTGTLLAAVQNSHLFNDCKHFVDMALKHDPETVLKNWESLVTSTNGEFTTEILANFVDENFDEPGCELEECQPDDFNEEIDNFTSITDPNYRKWAHDLHKKWPTLCRRVSQKVLSDPERFSLLAVPNPFVVPGGRFREIYYWDTFFIVKGLLASGMFSTARGMIENMGHLIMHYGFIPNGNRVYYLNRSQPPLLTWALHAYYQATNDLEFVKMALVWLEKEMAFFMANKTVQRPEWKYPLFRYHVIAAGPRPESYREDLESAEHVPDLLEKCRLWGDIAAAAESGRDFSTRWFGSDGPMAGQMGSTRTSQLLPVDLNAIICGNLRFFAELYDAVGENDAAARYREQFSAMRDTMHDVLWDEEAGCWFDYDLVHDCRINLYADTNFYPLYAGCTHDGFDAKRIAEYLAHVGVMEFPGGIPSSLVTSGQQWDFPNGWAPNTWVLINGLRAYGQEELAKTIADKWVRKNYFMWLNSGKMFEKYNVATKCCKVDAGGGEYELQEGFGWTNGVILDLLMIYKDELAWTANDPTTVPDCLCCRGHLPTDVAAVPEVVEPIIEEAILRSRKLSCAAQEASSILVHSAPQAQA